MRSRRTKRKLSIIFIFLFVTAIFGLTNIPHNKPIEKQSKTNIEKVQMSSQQKDAVDDSSNTIRNFEGLATLKNDQGIPVLMYHSVSDKKTKSLIMPVAKFRQQMDYLKNSGYITLTIDQVLSFLNNDIPIPKKSVLITLDDGYEDNYTNAFPILKELGLKATIFVITGNLNKDKEKLTIAQIKYMNKNGIDIESHTVNHDDLSMLPYKDQLNTLKASKDELENILGRKVNCLAYPYGKYNNVTAKAAQEAGYQMAFTVHQGYLSKTDDLFTLKRIRMFGTDTLADFIGKLDFFNNQLVE